MVFLLDVRVALGSRSLCLVGKLAELFPIRETFLCLISRQFNQIVCTTVSTTLQLVVEYLFLRQQLRRISSRICVLSDLQPLKFYLLDVFHLLFLSNDEFLAVPTVQ